MPEDWARQLSQEELQRDALYRPIEQRNIASIGQAPQQFLNAFQQVQEMQQRRVESRARLATENLRRQEYQVRLNMAKQEEGLKREILMTQMQDSQTKRLKAETDQYIAETRRTQTEAYSQGQRTRLDLTPGRIIPVNGGYEQIQSLGGRTTRKKVTDPDLLKHIKENPGILLGQRPPPSREPSPRAPSLELSSINTAIGRLLEEYRHWSTTEDEKPDLERQIDRLKDERDRLISQEMGRGKNGKRAALPKPKAEWWQGKMTPDEYQRGLGLFGGDDAFRKDFTKHRK